ncbi:Prophage tail fiber protein [plant metagenome]|uniref:Prophage tail fiber protein n=1 Tax=plant metagenome TaxID=1297885 RepID=A0A484QAF0_9ZZZZ
MAENQLLPFGGAAGANVLTPSEYAALGARAGGFQAGVAKSREVNTVLRQAAFAAAMIGQFSADRSDEDVLDDGDVAGFQAAFTRALLAVIDGRAVPYVNRADLPTTNQGPMFVLEANEIWTWSQSEFFSGYRSPLCGRPVDGHTQLPLPSEVDAVGGLLSKEAYAGLWGYARENSLVVTQAVWTANIGGHYFVDVNGTQFRCPDLRNQFRRFTGTDADTANARVLGSVQGQQFLAHNHGYGISQSVQSGTGGAAITGGVTPAANTATAGGAETRPVNVAYSPRLHA